jgi:hypothetical protein
MLTSTSLKKNEVEVKAFIRSETLNEENLLKNNEVNLRKHLPCLDDLIVTLVAEVGDLLQKLSFSFGYYKV